MRKEMTNLTIEKLNKLETSELCERMIDKIIAQLEQDKIMLKHSSINHHDYQIDGELYEDIEQPTMRDRIYNINEHLYNTLNIKEVKDNERYFLQIYDDLIMEEEHELLNPSVIINL